MKFSIKNLLAATLLISLTINGYSTLAQLMELREKEAKLKSSLGFYYSKTFNYEQRVLLYERALEATKNRRQKFAKLDGAFGDLIRKDLELDRTGTAQ